MLEPFLSEIVLFACDFAPKGWAKCQGQLLPINQNQALFALLGTTYGGNGQTTFALPDLRGRAALGFGQGPGLSSYTLGATAGSESATLSALEMASHGHATTHDLTAAAKCRTGLGNRQNPAGNLMASDAAGLTTMYINAVPDADMNAGPMAVNGSPTAANTGGGQAHTNVQPYLALTYCIALQGIFPSQN